MLGEKVACIQVESGCFFLMIHTDYINHLHVIHACFFFYWPSKKVGQ